MTLASSRGAFGATAIAAVQVISLVLGEEDDFEDTTMMYYCVLSIRGRERERERDFLLVVDNKCVLSKSETMINIYICVSKKNGGKNTLLLFVCTVSLGWSI